MASNFLAMNFPDIPKWLLVIAVAWVLAWKGVALWKSARSNHKVWFIVLLIVNTMAILEILYIFLFSKLDISKASRESLKGRRKTNKNLRLPRAGKKRRK